MPDDLVIRLRAVIHGKDHEMSCMKNPDGMEAANRIEQLEKAHDEYWAREKYSYEYENENLLRNNNILLNRIERLKEALRPFALAEFADELDDNAQAQNYIRVGDYRSARALFEELGLPPDDGV